VAGAGGGDTGGAGGIEGGTLGVGAASGEPQFSQNELPASFSLPQNVHLILSLALGGGITAGGEAGGFAGSVEATAGTMGAGVGGTSTSRTGIGGGVGTAGGAEGMGGEAGETDAAELETLVRAEPQLSQNAEPSMFSD